MIKTKALKKLANVLERKGLSEVDIKIEDGEGKVSGYRRGSSFEVTVYHDSQNIRVQETKVKWI